MHTSGLSPTLPNHAVDKHKMTICVHHNRSLFLVIESLLADTCRVALVVEIFTASFGPSMTRGLEQESATSSQYARSLYPMKPQGQLWVWGETKIPLLALTSWSSPWVYLSVAWAAPHRIELSAREHRQ